VSLRLFPHPSDHKSLIDIDYAGRICGQIFCARWFAGLPLRLILNLELTFELFSAPLISYPRHVSDSKGTFEFVIYASAKQITTLDNILILIIITLSTTLSPPRIPTPSHHTTDPPTPNVLPRSAITLHPELQDLPPSTNQFHTRPGSMERSNRFLKKTKTMEDRVALDLLMPTR
jgi:hypothetical protein